MDRRDLIYSVVYHIPTRRSIEDEDIGTSFCIAVYSIVTLLSQISDLNLGLVRRFFAEANPRILIKSGDRIASDVFRLFPVLF